jgi:Domain of unknown function DUF29
MLHLVQNKGDRYNTDYNLWLEETIALIRRGDLASVNAEHLIEELEGLAGRDRRELESRLQVLLEHILKRLHVNSASDNRGWEITIRTQRQELSRLLKQSPSLKCYFEEVFDEVYRDALNTVREDYPSTNFPDAWQFSRDIEAMLEENFWVRSRSDSQN